MRRFRAIIRYSSILKRLCNIYSYLMSTLFAARYVSLTRKYNVCRQVRRYKHTFTNCFKYIFQKEFPFGMVHIPARCEESSSRNSREYSHRQTVDIAPRATFTLCFQSIIFFCEKKIAITRGVLWTALQAVV